jgi:hypothetical protein
MWWAIFLTSAVLLFVWGFWPAVIGGVIGLMVAAALN